MPPGWECLEDSKEGRNDLQWDRVKLREEKKTHTHATLNKQVTICDPGENHFCRDVAMGSEMQGLVKDAVNGRKWTR